MESRCIICGNAREGLEVQQDYMIDAIRWLKRNVTRNEKGYRLVVCRECYPKYDKARHSYQRKRVLYTTLGIVFAFALLAISGHRFLIGLLYGFFIVAFLYLLSQLSYMPALHMPAKKEKAASAKPVKPAKSKK